MTDEIPAAILQILRDADTEATVIPATELYNEGWMLRLVLSAAAETVSCLPFSFSPGSKWFSEARLPSFFLARSRGDPLSETHTG